MLSALLWLITEFMTNLSERNDNCYTHHYQLRIAFIVPNTKFYTFRMSNLIANTKCSFCSIEENDYKMIYRECPAK